MPLNKETKPNQTKTQPTNQPTKSSSSFNNSVGIVPRAPIIF